ncbi:beta-fructofuranosidase [Phlyctema vagabunda]|uniref:Beta-fructofuranosidase n=1 Tax=Phlyctema vagabunda TaxID=108571 RepID=A0ABR4PSX4_9HELO
MKGLLCAGLTYLGLPSLVTRTCDQDSISQGIDNTHDVVTRQAPSYSDPWRPQVHFTPPQNFMNDPNGLFRDEDGLWHLYYQYAPTINPGYLKEWGHATSEDLYSWTNHPIAIPGVASPLYSIFSGSIVVDVDNTSGFFPNQKNGIVAFYTAYTDAEEAQAIAYSTDGGYTFTQYANNPIISLNQHDFRDPKVIWHAESQKWVMVVSHAAEHFIAFYTSSNLVDWTQVSTFSNPALTGTWECPQFLGVPFRPGSSPATTEQSGPLPNHYILAISLGGGGPGGGGIVKYVPGTFDGTNFSPFDSLASRVMDFGPDSYATAFFYDLKGAPEPISMSWAVNLQYATNVPTGTGEGWMSAMSVARTHYLANVSSTGWDLITEPYNFSPLIESTVASESKLGNGGLVIDYSTVASGTVQFSLNITAPSYSSPLANATVLLDFTASDTGEVVSLSFNLLTSASESGSPPAASFSMSRSEITGWTTAPLSTSRSNLVPFNSFSTSTAQTNYQIEGILDRTILEVYLNGGVDTGTMIFFPTGKLDTISLSVEGLGDGAWVDLEVLGLKSGWGSISGKRQRLRDGEDVEGRVDL